MAKFAARFWQNCATCELWVGPRQFHALMAASEVDEAAEGVCSGERKDSKTYATNSCAGWRKWAMLKAGAPGAPLSSERMVPV